MHFSLEFHLANVTLEWMNVAMHFIIVQFAQLRRLKAFVAFGAGKWPFTGMRTQMYSIATVVRESALAMSAFDFLAIQMQSPDVLVQCVLGVEIFVAA